jgi:nucleoside-diphosphate-sugar epimerase
MLSEIKRVIILGHSGFIGSNLSRVLLENSNWDIIGRSRSDIDLVQSGNLDQLAPYFSEDSALIVAAAVKRQFGDSLDVFRQNMAIVENVCNLLEENPVKRVIFFSSAAVYGEETENTEISEQTQVNPTSYYGIAKYSAERLLKKVCEASQSTSLVCLRPPLIYGPGDQGRTYGPAGFTANAIEGGEITLWGDGTELREFVFIEDICRMIKYLLDSKFNGELNAVSGARYCFADIIQVLESRFPDLEVESKPRSKQKADNAFISDRIKSLLPPSFAFTNLEDGISQMINKKL